MKIKNTLLILVIISAVFISGTLFVEAQDIYTTIADYGSGPDAEKLETVDTTNPNAYFFQLFNVFIAITATIAALAAI